MCADTGGLRKWSQREAAGAGQEPGQLRWEPRLHAKASQWPSTQCMVHTLLSTPELFLGEHFLTTPFKIETL